jgi:hypothetical protein
MKKWAFLVGAVVAMGAAAAVVSLALQQARESERLDQIPSLIEDCFDRIRRIEEDIHRLRPHGEAA